MRPAWRQSHRNGSGAVTGLRQAFPERRSFLSTGWLLAQLARQKKAARKRYIEFVKDGLEEMPESPWMKLKGQIFFGGAKFMASMQAHLADRQKIGEIPKEQRYPNRPSVADIFADIPDKTSRNRKICRAHRGYGYTLQEIAGNLGLHYSTVSRVAKLETQ